jgi:asparagine synthase (glutamine-hydrolysing)
MGGAGDGIDRQAMQLYLTLRYVPSPMTLWKGIKRLAPGYVLCLDLENGRQLQWCYVKPEDRRFIGDQNLAIEEYGRQLHEAIERQLLSDVPVGLLLSGGIDSALIAAVAKQAGQALPCFSVGFGSNHSECELADAEQTANTLELPFSRVQVTSEQLLESLPDIVNAVEEPMGTTSVMPMWFLIEHTRKSVKVVLTGQGSDEPWGGYRRYQMELVRRLLPSTRFWGLLDAGANVFAPLPEIIERGLRSLPVVGIAQRAVEACALFSSTDRQLLTGDAGDGGALIATKSWYQWLDATGCSAAEKMMRVDARMNLSDDLLLYGDKISMAHSLEARVPMLDTGLVSFIESLPLGYRLGLGRTKIVHKKLAQRFLPNSIVRRKKKGFQVPFSAWSRGPWQSFIENMLFSSDAPHWEILRKDGLRQLWSEHLTSRPDRSRQFFALLMLAIWWRMQ